LKTSRWKNPGWIAFLLGIFSLVDTPILQAQTASTIEVGSFSKASPGQELPEGWKPLTFQNIERKTQYRLVRDGEGVVVKAVADASASGLIREIFTGAGKSRTF
jgi:hypothetical protein